MESIYLINILFIHHRETKKYSSLHRFIRVTDLCYWLTAIPFCKLYIFFVAVNAGNAHVYFVFFLCPDINRLVFVGVWGFIFIFFLSFLFPRERARSFKTKYLYGRKFIQDEKLRQHKKKQVIFFFDLKIQASCL